MTEEQEEDLDLVERTPHAFRGEKWLAAARRLDEAGIEYVPGHRYYAASNLHNLHKGQIVKKSEQDPTPIYTETLKDHPESLFSKQAEAPEEVHVGEPAEEVHVR